MRRMWLGLEIVVVGLPPLAGPLKRFIKSIAKVVAVSALLLCSLLFEIGLD